MIQLCLRVDSMLERGHGDGQIVVQPYWHQALVSGLLFCMLHLGREIEAVSPMILLAVLRSRTCGWNMDCWLCV